MSQKRINTGRVTKPQKDKLIEIMNSNPRIARGQFGGPNSAKNSIDFWKNAALELNACGGANKNSDQWKKCWVDWKASVKKQQCAYKRFERGTGNLPACEGPKPVEGIDAEVLAFFAPDVVDGDGRTRESGLPQKFAEHETSVECEEVEFLIDEFPPVPNTNECLSIDVPEKEVRSTGRQTGPSYASALEEAKKENLRQHNEQMGVLKEILKCVQTIADEISNR